MKAHAGDLQIEVVHWLARLPFLGADELSLLLGTTKPYVARILGQLESSGWTEWITPSSRELENERLYVQTEACLPKLAEVLPNAEAELRQSIAVGRREVLERLVRLETVMGLNQFSAQLVSAVRDDEEVELAEFRSLPRRRSRAQTWWPPEVEAYGCLRWGAWGAPFFVAWDRAGAPSFHRRKRVSAWYAFRDARHPWGQDDIPPVLVVCPGQSEAMEWARAVLAPADRRKVPPLSVFLGDVQTALDQGPLGPVWYRPDDTLRAYLCERLPWRLGVPQETIGLSEVNSRQRLESMEKATPLRQWAKQAMASSLNPPKTGIEHLAALSIATSDGEAGQRLVDGLVEFGLVDSTDKGLKEEPITVRRYFLTRIGLRYLAARDGVPPRRYSRHGIIASPSESKKSGGTRLETLIRQLDHTVGANRFFVRLIGERGNGKPRLVRWLSPSETALKFSLGETTHWLRPDGAGDIYWEGKVHRFYLEWDRGTVSWPDMTEKLWIWDRWLAKSQINGTSTSISPHLLIVTSNPAREKVICGVLNGIQESHLQEAQCLTTTSNLLDVHGAFGCVWRGPMSEKRIAWQLGGV